MKLGDEIIYMTLPDKAILCVPNIYILLNVNHCSI
jgi:hypothetical protein